MSGATTELHGTSRIRIHDGQLERFKHLAQQCIDIIRTRDSGTIEYRIYLNPMAPRPSSMSVTATPTPVWNTWPTSAS